MRRAGGMPRFGRTRRMQMTRRISAARMGLLTTLADAITAIERSHPVRVAIDGMSASGKTSLADELVSLIEDRGRRVLRASLDDFKRPWSERHLYDRESGEGYYRNAYNCELIRTALLEPLGPGESRHYRSSSIDPLTQLHATEATDVAAADAILLADGVFLFRPEINDLWDYRIFLDLDFDLVLQRGATRDMSWAGSWDDAADLYRTRYIPSEEMYISEVDPLGLADVIIDQSDFDEPRFIRRGHA